ncbi:MAG TPA: hypothetical protein VMU96_12420 [Casimicrobiaceae bacterium]|nr:hypothetical protein [Casimicrobiaceae bacterium]
MNRNPDASPPSLATHFVAAVLAVIITVGIFAGVTELVLLGGLPFERLVAAERACAGRDAASEREACLRERVELQQRVSLAGN